MYWKNLFSTFLYWTLWTTKWSGGEGSVIDEIWFNDYNFSDIIISNIPNDFDWNTIDVQTYNLTTHGQGLANWLIKDKTLTINGWIIAEWDGEEGAKELERKINRIKWNLLQGEWILHLKRKTWTLQTKAVVSAFSIPRESHTINAIEIAINFKILDPFFYSESLSELAMYWVDQEITQTVNYSSGSQQAKPSIFISFNQAIGVDTIWVTINGKTIQIENEINDGDIIDINAEKLNVWINGVYGINRLWEFGWLDFWDNEVNIKMNWEYNADIFIKYRDTYV